MTEESKDVAKESLSLWQKLVEVRKSVTYLQKESKGNQYNYVGSSQVLAAVRGRMDELGILLIPSIRDVKVTTGEHINSKGNKSALYFTELFMDMEWVNSEKQEESIKVPWYGQGVDIAGEKGVGKALTYAEKYFILKSFNIATDKDDPDAFQQKHGDHAGNDGIKDSPGGGDNTTKDKPQGDIDAARTKFESCRNMTDFQEAKDFANSFGWAEDHRKEIIDLMSAVKQALEEGGIPEEGK